MMSEDYIREKTQVGVATQMRRLQNQMEELDLQLMTMFEKARRDRLTGYLPQEPLTTATRGPGGEKVSVDAKRTKRIEITKDDAMALLNPGPEEVGKIREILPPIIVFGKEELR